MNPLASRGGTPCFWKPPQETWPPLTRSSKVAWMRSALVRTWMVASLVGWATAFFAGCSAQTPEHPPRLELGCVDESCPVDRISTVPLSPSEPSGLGGNTGSTVLKATELRGSISLVTDDRFVNAVAYRGSATVNAESVSSQWVTQSVTPAGAVSLPGVLLSNSTWVLVEPAMADVFPTLQPVDTTVASGATSLIVVGSEPVDLALRSLIVGATTRPVNAAQVLLFLEDSQGQGVSGVSVIYPSAEVVAYGVAGILSQAAKATDGSGLVFIGNVPALDLVQESTFGVKRSTGTLAFSVRILAGAVTWARLRLPD